jgi:gamma-glutamylcyclotransferase (GGCT)/AIG2-like uncharacterized protein YtfP
MSDWLFVYGTLRRACAHPLQRLLAEHAQPAGLACFAGRLFDLGRYPGAVPDAAAHPPVRGELYRLPDPHALLPLLDRYEGCTDRNDPAAEYRRERRIVVQEAGPAVSAWIYLYNRPIGALRPIASGDYLQRRAAPVARPEGAAHGPTPRRCWTDATLFWMQALR